MDFEIRNAMSTNELLSIRLFFPKVRVVVKEIPTVIWVNYSIIFPSLNDSLVSANRPICVLLLICLYRFPVIECPCYFANLIIIYLSFKISHVWPSSGKLWWFTRPLVDLVEWSSFALRFLSSCMYYTHGTCICCYMPLLTFYFSV